MEQGGQSAEPPKKLVRQLDFTSSHPGAPSPAPIPAEKPQHLLHPQSLPQPQPQPQPQQRLQLQHPHQVQLPRPQMSLLPLPRPALPLPIPVKLESPKSRPRPIFEVKDSTPTRKKGCNCKSTRCLKLYCECFASGTYCDGCNCSNCCNNIENEAVRHEAVEATLERNPTAFRPKIDSSPHAIRSREDAGELAMVGKHNKGCHCKKSGCLKKYCECFEAGILCSENCKCLDCKNFDGSEERKALCHGNHGNTLAYIQQQATRAAFNGAIGASGFSFPASKKRKNHELFLGTSVKEQSILRLAQPPQASNVKTSGFHSSVASVPTARPSNPPLGSSKVIYRPLLADIIQPEDLKALCKLLVEVSRESANAFTDKKVHDEKLTKREEQTESSLAASKHGQVVAQKETDVPNSSADYRHDGAHADEMNIEDSGSDSSDGQKGERPMSPGTLALMCDEQDPMFITSRTTMSPRFVNDQSISEFYAEQERCVLTEFRDYIQNLINCGRKKEVLMALRSEILNQQESAASGTNHQ